VKKTSSFFLPAFLFLGAAKTGAAGIPPPVEVTTQQIASGDRDVCRFRMTNHTPQPIVAFAVGGNANLAGPYELTAAPLGFNPDTGAAVQAPDLEGWEESLLREPAGSTFAVEWQTKDYAKAVMPEASETFELAYDEGASACRQGHWTAITRDSQVHTGVLSAR
jgi:hypothetical protein